jgi:hypothetical protein
VSGTDPLLPRAFELIQAWGFEYKTVGFYWVKLNTAAKHDADYFTGLGYWTRANPEQCILATRGKPQRQAKDVRRLVVDKRREHSRKPDAVRERMKDLWVDRISNCLRVRRSRAGTAGAINSRCSIKAGSRHGANPHALLTCRNCCFRRWHSDAEPFRALQAVHVAVRPMALDALALNQRYARDRVGARHVSELAAQ